MFYSKVRRKIQCQLCPHQCQLQESKAGLCGVRFNIGGRIKNRQQGLISGMASDPIEKKPLYHFYPGKEILSIGGFGCNLKCNFCQNWQISQVTEMEMLHGKILTPSEIIEKAMFHPNNIGIAFTYNEPTVWFEFMHETATLAKAKGLKTVVVSNGYIQPDPLEALISVIDAFNIDLKAFTSSFYREMAGGELEPVLNSLKMISKYQKHLEITNLLIPNKNDDPDIFLEMVKWIKRELGVNTPLHLSRYFPKYKLAIPATPELLLDDFFKIAKTELSYVYLGNVHNPEFSSTYCPSCNHPIIIRKGYAVNIDKAYNGLACPKCNANIVIESDTMAL
jgi:pyruvate formate lyase activating enzyme